MGDPDPFNLPFWRRVLADMVFAHFDLRGPRAAGLFLTPTRNSDRHSLQLRWFPFVAMAIAPAN